MKNTVAIIAIMFSVSTATADERNTTMADQLAALALMDSYLDLRKRIEV